MQRKETFATSGPHIKVRFFGGWDYAARHLTGQADWVKTAYAGGVPMGGDLPPRRAGKAPTFVVWAVKDPTSGNLDRIQIVKGWTKNGQSFEKIYDVVWAGDRKPDQVDRQGAADRQHGGHRQRDLHQHDRRGRAEDGLDRSRSSIPSLHAFYYARVLEIPTPRWTTIQAKELGIAPPDDGRRPRCRSAPGARRSGTRRRRRRASASPGTTVADLRESGAAQLTTDELNQLVKGRYTWVRNNVTGGIFKVQWADDGRMLIMNVDPRIPQPSEVGDLAQGAYLGQSATYTIGEDKIVTNFGNRDYEITVFKRGGGTGDMAATGDTYVAARSNEFGYANYEVIPTPVFLGTEVTGADVPTGETQQQ